jgi:hypothetical protein
MSVIPVESAKPRVFSYAIQRFSLQTSLLSGGIVSSLLQVSKLFLGQPALEKENAVHMTMGSVVVVNGGDELKMSAQLFFNSFDGLPGDML